jgi:hypothetical protein
MAWRAVGDDGIFRAEHLVQRQHPDIHQQRRQERLLNHRHAELLGEQPRRGRGVNAAAPVRQVIEPAPGLDPFQVGDQREPEHDRLDAVQAQHDQRVVDSTDRVAEPVEVGIDGLEGPGGQRRILRDHPRHRRQRDLGILGHPQHFDRHPRQRRQRRTLLDPIHQ